MSTELKTIRNTGTRGADLQITQFSGGKERGIMIQLTQGFGTIINMDEPGFISLTIEDAYKVCIELMKWIKTITHEKAEDLEAVIKEKHELKNTIIQEAVECERFIADLKIIEIPVRLLK